jgi:hypothetical protein
MFLEVETKPNGYRASWLIIGPIVNGVVKKKGYPQQSTKLKVKREYIGEKNSQRIFWTIEVPDGYPWGIAKIQNEPDGVGTPQKQNILYVPGT